MKKILIITLLLSSTFANALEYLSELPANNYGKVNLSAVKWVADTFNTIPMTGFPGKNDTVNLRGAGEFTIVIDKDFTTGHLLANGNIFAENRKLNFKTIETHLSPGEEGHAVFTMKNCNLKVTQNFLPVILQAVDSRQAGRMTLKFIDSVAKFNGLYNMVILNGNIKNARGPGGATLSLEGKSVVEFGGILIDSFAATNPNQISSEFEFAEKDGNLPLLVFGTAVNDVAKTNIKVRITPSAKKGRYTLVDFTAKTPFTGEFVNLTINGKKVAFDEARQVGNLKATLIKMASPTGKDRATGNDIVLVIEEVK